jgi:SAM-dependent methyltransferase
MQILSRLLLRPAAVDPAPPAPELPPADAETRVDVRAAFFAECARRRPGRVLEVGTLQAVPGRSTHHRGRFPDAVEYIRSDIAPGPDVDVVADLHQLPAEWSGRFDAFVAVAVFEHLERPWRAAAEVARVLAPGGLFFVSTHQCFPLHGYPSDFFRFSREALRLIFEDAGLAVSACDYAMRCAIMPPAEMLPAAAAPSWNRDHPSFILVNAFGRNPG